MWCSVVLSCFFVVILNSIAFCKANCTYATNVKQQIPLSHNRLSELLYKTYYVEQEDYIFYIGICTTAKDDIDKTVGVLQVSVKTKEPFEIGRINDTSIRAGRNWVLLEYGSGKAYNSHCSQESRKAAMMFTCNAAVTGAPSIRVLEENKGKIRDCYYLFELAHSSICSEASPDRSLSVGSIIVIAFCLLAAVYMVVGFFVQRLRGAKGLDQIPNYGAWQECGNLIADGCDFIFRSRPKASNHFYPHMDGAARQTLQPDDRHLIDDEDPDEHMLPM